MKKHAWKETRVRRTTPTRGEDSLPDCITNVCSFQCDFFTFRAAILDVPTTFPSLSLTSMPVNSSWFLISTTLQMFAVARRQEKKVLPIIHSDRFARQFSLPFYPLFALFPTREPGPRLGSHYIWNLHYISIQ